jgi:hypothetical protein
MCFETSDLSTESCSWFCGLARKECYNEFCGDEGIGDTVRLHVSTDCGDEAPILVPNAGPDCSPFFDEFEIPDTNSDGEPGPVASVECCCGDRGK